MIEDLYGVACFHKLAVDDIENERGARMRSVGVLVSDYRAIVTHYAFCEKQVQRINEMGRDIADTTALENYMSEYCHDTGLECAIFRPISDVFVNDISRSVGAVSSLFRFYGEHLLTIWKALLLRKRIIFYHQIPMALCALEYMLVDIYWNYQTRL